MKKRTNEEKMEQLAKSIKPDEYYKKRFKTIYKFSSDDYKMSSTECDCYEIIYHHSQLKDHCFTASTKKIEYATGKSRSTIMRALKRLEENLIIIKFETTTKVPFYVPRDLYYARIYHRIDHTKYYPDNIVDVTPEITKIKQFYNNDSARIRNQIITFIKDSKALEVKLDKELKSAPFLPNKSNQPTYF